MKYTELDIIDDVEMVPCSDYNKEQIDWIALTERVIIPATEKILPHIIRFFNRIVDRVTLCRCVKIAADSGQLDSSSISEAIATLSNEDPVS